MQNIVLLLIIVMLAGCWQSENTIVPAPQDELPQNISSLTLPETTAIPVQNNNLDNKLLAWGFKREKNQAPSMPQNIISMLQRYDGYYLGNTKEKILYLTFDEGYENGYTAQILDILKKTEVPAAFFITGPYLEKENQLIQRMLDEGHTVGNHTINHPSMPSITDNEKLKQEIAGLSDSFESKFGKKMKYIRPPKGEYSERTLSLCQSMGYKTIFWSSAYVDWDTNKQKGVQNALEKVTGQFHNGSIILLHAVSIDNANALEQIIQVAREQGFRFASLDEL